jgi:hypothetical protein
LVLCDTSGGALTVTLYPAADFISPLTIKNISTSGNDVTVDGDGSELIDGSLTQTLVDAQSQSYTSNSAAWFGAGVSSGTSYTTTNLLFGDGLDTNVSGPTTTIDVDVTDPTVASSTTQKGFIETATAAEDLTGTATDLASTPAGQAAINPIIQHYIETEIAGATTANIIPADDTPPQITEGGELFSVVFTPKLATSKVVVDVNAMLDNANNSFLTIALFVNGGASAVCSRTDENGSSTLTMPIKHSFSPGSTNPITFSVRFGGNLGTDVFAGTDGRYMGASASSTIEIREIRP